MDRRVRGLDHMASAHSARTSTARPLPAVAAPRGLGMIAILITLATLARLAVAFLAWPAGASALLAAAVLWSIGVAAALALHLALAR